MFIHSFAEFCLYRNHKPRVHHQVRQILITNAAYVTQWPSGYDAAWTCDQHCRRFKSLPLRCRVQPWASCLHTCASVTKQYNLVPANGALMPCSCEGNRRSDVAMATCHTHYRSGSPPTGSRLKREMSTSAPVNVL